MFKGYQMFPHEQHLGSPGSPLWVIYVLVNYHHFFIPPCAFSRIEVCGWMNNRRQKPASLHLTPMRGTLLSLCYPFTTCLTPFFKRKEQGNFINWHAKPEILPIHQVCPYSQQDHAHLLKKAVEYLVKKEFLLGRANRREISECVCMQLIKSHHLCYCFYTPVI